MTCKIAELSDKTVGKYKSDLSLFSWWLEKFYPGKLFTELGSKEAREFLFYLKEPQKLRWGVENSKEKLTTNTIRNYATPVKSFFSWLENQEYISKSPFKNLPLISKSKKFTSVNNILGKNLQTLFRYLIKNNTNYTGCRNLALITLMLDSGARRGEIMSMQVRDVDFKLRRCNIRGKKGDRTIFFSETCASALQEYWRKYRSKQGDNPESEYWRTSDDNPLSFSSLGMIMHRLRDETGVKVHSHALRHTFCTMMASKINIFELMSLMGHSSIKTTQIYYHANEENLSITHNSNSPLSSMDLLPMKKGRGRPRKT